MLGVESAVLILVDFQEKLVRAMFDRETVVQEAVKLVKGAQALGLPILRTEQNPEGLGPTIPELKQLLQGSAPVTKLSFSCCGEQAFLKKLEELEPEQVIIAGLESHVCVYQSVLDLLEMVSEVHVVADAVSSRTQLNKQIGLDRCLQEGAFVTSVETVLFELLGVAEGEEFKQILKIVK
ncbi:MAG: hydrolase [Deltaproteobacteria bacterium]|nr:hydrolase [Deltaproteobacteria bacterium]